MDFILHETGLTGAGLRQRLHQLVKIPIGGIAGHDAPEQAGEWHKKWRIDKKYKSCWFCVRASSRLPARNQKN